jgi:hypothetical protein
MGLQGVDEVVASELRALIGIENLRDPKAPQRLVKTVHAESRIERIAEPPGQQLSAIPVDNRHPVTPTLGVSISVEKYPGNSVQNDPGD